MRCRYKHITMPSIDDIIMQIMAMSQTLYEGAWTVSMTVYDAHRPQNWPTARYLLRFYGYQPSADGWTTMVDMHIGIDCKTTAEGRG